MQGVLRAYMLLMLSDQIIMLKCNIGYWFYDGDVHCTAHISTFVTSQYFVLSKIFKFYFINRPIDKYLQCR